MYRVLRFVGVLVFFLSNAASAEKTHSSIVLDGETVSVYWSDGDSFSVQSPGLKEKFRISDYNTLESYGPVHRWGEWTSAELAEIADQATAHVRRQTWTCTRARQEDGTKKKDGYGRTIVSCPDVTFSLVTAGLAHLFLFGEESIHGRARTLQRKAQEGGRGMWKKGVPAFIITSLHSGDEKTKKSWTPYNRFVDTATGFTKVVEHENNYGVCEEVCLQDSCMTYVPYTQRYGPRRPSCLKRKTPAPETE